MESVTNRESIAILQFFSPVLLPDAEKVAQHRGWDHFATAAATFRLAGERNTDDLTRVSVENRPTAVSRVNGGVDLPADHNQYTLETELPPAGGMITWMVSWPG